MHLADDMEDNEDLPDKAWKMKPSCFCLCFAIVSDMADIWDAADSFC